MKKFLLNCVLCSSIIITAQNVPQNTVYVSGRGHNQETAVLDALMQAVTRRNRTYIVNEEKVLNNKHSEKRSTFSFGRIAGFDIVESRKLDNSILIQLAVSFQSGDSTGENQVSNQEIWNFAQQLKYFNVALEQLGAILLDPPLRTILKKHSFSSVSDNNDKFLLTQNWDVYIDKSLYNAQMSAIQAILDIYCENKRIFSYNFFKTNHKQIIAEHGTQKKIYIADANCRKIYEYTVKEQFFKKLADSMKDNRWNYVINGYYFNSRSENSPSAPSREVLTIRHTLDPHRSGYSVITGNEIMFYPVFSPALTGGTNPIINVTGNIELNKKRISNSGVYYAQYSVSNRHSDGKKTPPVSINLSASNIKTIEATGFGATPDEAEKDAVKEALVSVCGSAISSNTIIKNDEIESEQIISKTAGVVQKYDVIKNEKKRGAYSCRINAAVNISKLLLLNNKLQKFDIRFPDVVNMLNQNREFEKSGRQLALEVYDRVRSSFFSRMIGKIEMGSEAKIDQNTVSGLKYKIRIGVKLAHYRQMVQDLAPIIRKNALDSFKVDLYGKVRNIEPALKKYKSSFSKSQHTPGPIPQQMRDRRRNQQSLRQHKTEVPWHFAVVQFNAANRPESIVFYNMPEKFMKGYRDVNEEKKQRLANWRASHNFSLKHNYLLLFVDFFNKENKAVDRSNHRIICDLPVKRVFAGGNKERYIWSPIIGREKNFKDIELSLRVHLSDLQGDNLNCVSEVIHLYEEPGFLEFSRYDLDAFEYNETINRKSPFFGHEWYYLQEVLKKRGTLYSPRSEYAVYYSHVADNIPLPADWNNGGLGFVPAIKAIDGAFEVLTMSPYSTVLQGDKVYSFNGKSFNDIKELFSYVKQLPAGTGITMQTDKGKRSIVLPPRDMAQDYWQKQLPENHPVVPPLPAKVYKGFIDHEARKLFDQKKYYEAWEATKDKNPCDLELLGNLARALYFAKNEPQKQETSNSRQMGSINDYMDSFSRAKPHEVAEFARNKGSADGAFFYALYWEQFKNWQSQHNLRSEMHVASDMGNADADNYLAYIYSNGIGCNRHANLALSYLKKSAAQYHALSEFELGKFYLYGWTDYKNKINEFKAHYWLKRSATHGNSKAAELLKSSIEESQRTWRPGR